MIKNIDKNEIKFLPVTQEDIVLALDRLTRFKSPEIAFYRVISDILCKYLLSPKFSKKEIQNTDIKILKEYFEMIWNCSVQKYAPESHIDNDFNKFLYDELNSVYCLNEEIKELADLNINISGVLDIAIDLYGYDSLPVNIKHLVKNRYRQDEAILVREKYNLLFPVEKVILCEGITEEILLPEFAKIYGYNFDKYGVKLISAGGKSQLAKLYCGLKDELKIPVFILLDADAKETANSIKDILRDSDKIYLIKHGEFEDIFSLNLIKRTINNRFKNICECRISDFKKSLPMTKILAEFFRIHELGDFQKAEFAREVAMNLKYKSDLTDEIIFIINEIKKI